MSNFRPTIEEECSGIRVLYNLPILQSFAYPSAVGCKQHQSSNHDKRCKKRRKKNRNKKTHRQ